MKHLCAAISSSTSANIQGYIDITVISKYQPIMSSWQGSHWVLSGSVLFTQVLFNGVQICLNPKKHWYLEKASNHGKFEC